MKNNHYETSQAPSDKLSKHGERALSNAELLAVVLSRDDADLASDLLDVKFGSLGALASATYSEISGVIGADDAAKIKAIFEIQRRLLAEYQTIRPLIDSPENAVKALAGIENEPQEHCKLLLLDTRHRLIKIETLSIGTIDSSLVHPRDIFRIAISCNAAAYILAHNHPSGDPSPSQADTKMTREIIKASEIMRIQILDHVIIGKPSTDNPKGFVSLKEQGILG